MDVDDLPGAAYFRQAANGVPVRMALLTMVMGGYNVRVLYAKKLPNFYFRIPGL